MKKSKIALITLVLFVLSLTLFLSFMYTSIKKIESSPPQNNVVSIEGDTQIITILSKGGYFPPEVNAKAGMKTIIKMQTKGSFDCGNALVIPQLKLQKTLPPTGLTEIPLEPQQAGSALLGSCSMGMYQLKINFN